jgi:hypothetical protein
MVARSKELSTTKVTARFRQRRDNAKGAFKSWGAFKEWVMVPDTALDVHGHSRSGITWSNVDLDPTPPERRTWRWWNCKATKQCVNVIKANGVKTLSFTGRLGLGIGLWAAP